MDQNGQPDPKRPRLNPSCSSWSSETHNTISLPPPRPLPPAFQQGHSPQTYSQDPEDHRKTGPPHSYIHPPPTFKATRETMLKRDPAETSPPSLYIRPPTAGSGQEYHLSAHEDNRGQMAPPYASRPDHQSNIPAGPNYRPNNYPPPPPSPISVAPSYEPGTMYHGLPHPQDPYAGKGFTHNPPITTTAKRKAQRASQACDSCRTLKAKCDEGRPDCGSCKEKRIRCVYRDPPPKQVDKTTNDILEGVWRLEEQAKRQFEAFENVRLQVEHISRDHERLKAVVFPPRPSVDEGSQGRSRQHAGPYPPRSAFRESYNAHPHSLGDGQADEEAPSDEELGEPVPPGKSSIPVNHTTGAARLLLCGPIGDLVKGVLKHRKVFENFPMWQEERRGCLRIFGRGEGNDLASGYDKDPLTDYGDDAASADTSSDISSPAAGEEWGQLGVIVPPGSVEMSQGAVGSSGMPDFDRATVHKLVHSFKENINNLHPLLVPSQLDAMTENFLRSIPDGSARTRKVEKLSGGGHAGFVTSNPQSPGNKRKRSPAADILEPVDAWGCKPGHPFRTINSALTLMVLALGKICLHKGKLPDIHNERNIDPTVAGTPSMCRNGTSQSPRTTSPHTSVLSPDGFSPHVERAQPRSRRASVEGGSNPARYTKKNLDVIPGLAYFALATDIIGNQLGGNSLQHAHVNLLAGLYHAQLARPIESYAYIQKACLVVQFLMRPKLERFKKIALSMEMPLVPKRDNPLVFAFWTCLQLESDILAELPCPHSGILNFEDVMPSPNLSAAGIDGFEEIVVRRYHQQLLMRKHLNMLHGMFYKPDVDDSHPSKHFPTIQAVEDNLSNLVTWNEEERPSVDILTARLRAKYYGAQVITYRPFLLKILERSAMRTSKPGYQVSSDFKTGIDVPSINKSSLSHHEVNPKALAYARKCIRALINSTAAFHGIADPGEVRLIVTNVWGTAHAQWGNCIVLQAAYKDPILGPEVLNIIDADALGQLVEKTVQFLKLMSMPSCALTTDWKLLEAAGWRTKLLPRPTGSTASGSFSGSFSSVY